MSYHTRKQQEQDLADFARQEVLAQGTAAARDRMTPGWVAAALERSERSWLEWRTSTLERPAP